MSCEHDSRVVLYISFYEYYFNYNVNVWSESDKNTFFSYLFSLLGFRAEIDSKSNLYIRIGVCYITGLCAKQ